MLTKSLWCVVDPKFDRPFFSSEPPPDTLRLGEGGCVIRYDYPVHDLTPAVLTADVKNEQEARENGLLLFTRTRDSLKKP